ncbi:MAG: hypothetical protein B7Z35_03090 [Hydrogenophilales bacterium 12-61-10]|nr:MAG: hypothetical protein B7Z35_03090 [Hydrogenophilales bacterium 12-61-10]OYX27926.1 MAG: hypothetical protein B7Z03_12805 [Hydrogenophilales bacterium 32-62-9]
MQSERTSERTMFENKKIVIVGGSSGIGYAVAKKAMNAGAQVVIASRSNEKLNAAAKQLDERVQTEVVDASDDQSVADFFRRVGHFDHLAVTIKPQLPSGRFLENEVGATITEPPRVLWRLQLLRRRSHFFLQKNQRSLHVRVSPT